MGFIIFIIFISLKIEKDSGKFINKAIKDVRLREIAGVNLVAIKRKGSTITDITGDHKLKLGDLIYIVGKPDALESFRYEMELE